MILFICRISHFLFKFAHFIDFKFLNFHLNVVFDFKCLINLFKLKNDFPEIEFLKSYLITSYHFSTFLQALILWFLIFKCLQTLCQKFPYSGIVLAYIHLKMFIFINRIILFSVYKHFESKILLKFLLSDYFQTFQLNSV